MVFSVSKYIYMDGHGFHSYVSNDQRIMNLDNSYSMTSTSTIVLLTNMI